MLDARCNAQICARLLGGVALAEILVVQHAEEAPVFFRDNGESVALEPPQLGTQAFGDFEE